MDRGEPEILLREAPPENLLHHSRHEEGVFTFLLTGDALYSLIEPETMRIWEIILSLPSVRIICDRQELSLRGISVEGLKMKHPDQVIDHNRLGVGGQQSFWNDVAKIARQHEQPIPSTIRYSRSNPRTCTGRRCMHSGA